MSRNALPNDNLGYYKFNTKTSTSGSGIPVKFEDDKFAYDPRPIHSLLYGTSLADEEVYACLIMSIIGDNRESALIVDNDYRLEDRFATTAKEKGYLVHSLNFFDLERSADYNPLAYSYEIFKQRGAYAALNSLTDLAENFIPLTSGDAFWDSSARSLFIALCIGLFEDAENCEQVNLNSISRMISDGQESFATSTYLKEYFKLKSKDSLISQYASSWLVSARETASGINSVLTQKTRDVSIQNQKFEKSGNIPIDFDDMILNKSLLFLQIQPGKLSGNLLASYFIREYYERVAKMSTEDRNKFNFIISDFTPLPVITEFEQMLTDSLRKQIKFHVGIKSYAALIKIYGADRAETIISLLNNWFIFSCKEPSFIKTMETVIGTEAISEIKYMRSDRNEYYISLLNFDGKITKIECNKEMKPKLYLSQRTEKRTATGEVVDTFDIASYVKEAKRNKLFEAIETTDNESNKSANVQEGHKLDIDDLVRRIDKKIAEIEGQEQIGKEKEAKDINLRTKLPKPVMFEKPITYPFATMKESGIELNVKSRQERILSDDDRLRNDDRTLNGTRRDGRITIIDEGGKEIECDVLFTFDSEETEKSYIVFTDNTVDENGYIKVYANTYNPDGRRVDLGVVETKKEWHMIEELLKSLQDKTVDPDTSN
ncbi:MAG: type IV secretion system DNA-binding domain-containing protein [Oscillospiraceae bacterium]|nr:type IV secretion system DNA-binding domain-containing protein [Oscillospiraceae bacterium]